MQSSQVMSMEDFSKTVSPHDLRVVVARFEKKWIGDSVSEILQGLLKFFLTILNQTALAIRG
jgi:hypothetical protein